MIIDIIKHILFCWKINSLKGHEIRSFIVTGVLWKVCIIIRRNMNQNMVYIALCMLVLIHVAIQEAAASTVPTSASDTAPSGECRDVLQGYLTGQLTSALGSLQVENLRKEFQRIIENQNADIERLQSTVADLKLRPNETGTWQTYDILRLWYITCVTRLPNMSFFIGF